MLVIGVQGEQVPGGPGDVVDLGDALTTWVHHDVLARAIGDAVDLVEGFLNAQRVEQFDDGLLTLAQHEHVGEGGEKAELGHRADVLAS